VNLHLGNLREPPCDKCYVELDLANVETMQLYRLVCGQMRVAPSGKVIGLDYDAVLKTIELYADGENVKKLFEDVRLCYRLEQEFTKEQI